MSLFCFADEEAVEQGRTWMLLGTPSAGIGNVTDDGIGAKGQAANGLSLDGMLFKQFENGEAGEAPPLSVQRSGPAIDVVIARAPGTERELAEAKTGRCEEREKLFCVRHTCRL
jgi:hypothetical protein